MKKLNAMFVYREMSGNGNIKDCIALNTYHSSL